MAHGGPSKKKLNNGIDDEDEFEQVAGIDGVDNRWGWIIVAASFFIHIISKSFCYLYTSNAIFPVFQWNRRKGWFISA